MTTRRQAILKRQTETRHGKATAPDLGVFAKVAGVQHHKIRATTHKCQSRETKSLKPNPKTKSPSVELWGRPRWYAPTGMGRCPLIKKRRSYGQGHQTTDVTYAERDNLRAATHLASRWSKPNPIVPQQGRSNDEQAALEKSDNTHASLAGEI